MKLCRNLASRFCISQSWNAEFLHYLFVVDFLMNLAGKWLCRIFASRFCKSQTWNAEFLHYPFVVNVLMNLAGKWLCRILASRFCKCQTWNAEFLHYPFVVDFLMNLALKWLRRIFASRDIEHLGSLERRLELHSAAPRATLTPLSCSPNFPRAQYLDIRTLTHELIVNWFFLMNLARKWLCSIFLHPDFVRVKLEMQNWISEWNSSLLSKLPKCSISRHTHSCSMN